MVKFRKKIPDESKPQRNCQLLIVTASVAITLATSFGEFVDFAAHFGGAFQGIILGGLFLSYELENIKNRTALRITFFLVWLGSFIWAVYILVNKWNPKDTTEYWENNDDWHKHGF